MNDLHPGDRPQIIPFTRNMELITHPSDRFHFVLGRDACGPFVGLLNSAGDVQLHPHLLNMLMLDGPAARMAEERLREEREKDRREGRTYPDRCGPPIS